MWHDGPQTPSTLREARAEQVTVLFTALAFASALAVGMSVQREQCRVRDVCTRAGTCVASRNAVLADYGCGFVALPRTSSAARASVRGIAEARAVASVRNASAGARSLWCAAGETLDPLCGECRMARPYPDALNRAAFGDQGAASASERACGAWIRSTPSRGPHAWYMSEATQMHYERDAAELVRGATRLSTPDLLHSDMAAFVGRCRADGAAGASTVVADAQVAWWQLAEPLRTSALE